MADEVKYPPDAMLISEAKLFRRAAQDVVNQHPGTSMCVWTAKAVTLEEYAAMAADSGPGNPDFVPYEAVPAREG